MTCQTIPACKDCNHYQEDPDEIFSTCDVFFYETTDSVWYNSPEQVKKREERSQRLRELYDAARKAREKVND